MKKISFVMKREEHEKLQQLRELIQLETGFRTTVSDLVRGLVLREARARLPAPA
jgi:hypothetical protein